MGSQISGDRQRLRGKSIVVIPDREGEEPDGRVVKIEEKEREALKKIK